MFLNNWSTIDDMKGDFWPDYDEDTHPLTNELDGVTILLASYGTPAYEGDAFVLFEKGGQLFEVNGSHCSCYGLEGQWKPEPTTAAELLHRVEKGELGNNDYQGHTFADELRQVLSKIQ